MSLRVGLITTLSTNIGDDFIRTGLRRVVQEVFAGKEIEFVSVNKHEPHTAYPRWHPIRVAALAKYLPRGKGTAEKLIHRSLATPSLSKFEDCAAIIQCGAPVLWPGCHECEWAEPLWHGVVGRLHKRIPIFNLAAGSCYPWEHQPTTVENRGDAEFLTAIHSYCRLTTVRDRLSRHLFGTLGCAVSHIPCSALLAADEPKSQSNGDGPVLINYMPGGGHYDFGQGVDGSTWRETIRSLVARLRGRHRVEFLCHNEAELSAASSVADGLPCHLPKSVAEYFTVVSGAKAGIFNRMHASVALAGMGVPSIAIGTDTRLLMVEHLGLPCFYVKEAGMESLEEKLEGLMADRAGQRERLLGLRRETMRTYTEAVSNAWS